ncbi:hypothetical protein HYC85_022454 [Camellia sinensis]|uniref:Phospholipid/glycerol acyltransferase domain-containing protein n=1 Tax=Camellia sinensis TaxID=4442 RepID=A0A7J7GLB7_CAMSI|nr:hypothetical protein HYC85_022454 [Camellia sinensis]
MAIPAGPVIVSMGVLFFLSGLVVNLIQVLLQVDCIYQRSSWKIGKLADRSFQAICFVLVRPLSKNTYRKINRVVAELLWLELVWIVDWWAGVKIKLFTDSETFRLMGKEHALVVSNHKSDIDWLVGWVLAQRAGCLGSALAVMKKSSKFLPVIGWSMWFSEYLFLERSWAKDEITLKSGLQRLKDFPLPFWLALFVEGTRFTQAKLEAAQEYAASAGLPVPRNVLIPRTKGFVSAVSQMRSFVPAVYEVTVAIPKSSPPPTMLRLFKGQSSVMHVHLKRHLMKDLPEQMMLLPNGRYLLGMSAHFWGLKILSVDFTSIHMEGYGILGNWVSHCHIPYADLDPILSVRALDSCQGRPIKAQERRRAVFRNRTRQTQVAGPVIVSLGVLFFLSGLIVNLIQAICFVLVRPLSKNTYRKINRVVAELLWLELVWLVDWWAGVQNRNGNGPGLALPVPDPRRTLERSSLSSVLCLCFYGALLPLSLCWDAVFHGTSPLPLAFVKRASTP